MAKGKEKKLKASSARSPVIVGERVRAALRSIARDWQALRAPLPVDPVTPDSSTGSLGYRVRGAESHEELLEHVLQFAGRVWQLKDGLIKWLKTRPALRMTFTEPGTSRTVVGGGGRHSEKTIEDAAKLSLPLLLCADLYNTHKHYDDCNRSGYQPFLNGVRFQTADAGAVGIRYDGARKIAELLVTKPSPMPFCIEILSGNLNVEFGDAVVVIGRAFRHWLPLIRQMGLLSPSGVADKAILDDLASFEEELDKAQPFKAGETCIDIDRLQADQRICANTDAAGFIARLSR